MSNPGFSVLIPDGESDFALFVCHGFVNYPQVKVYVLSNQRWSPIRFSRYCETYIFKRFDKVAGSRFDTIAEVIAEHKIDVVLSSEMEWIAPYDAQRHNLSKVVAVAPTLDAATFRLVNNKWSLFDLMQKNDIPAPPTVLCTLDDDFEQKVQHLEFPVLIKPVTAWGGEGIHRFENISQLYQFLERSNDAALKNRYIIQSFLRGYVVGLNVLCRDGEILAYTIQRGFISNSQKYAAAAAIQFVKRDDVLEIGKRLLSILHYNGVANLDMFYDDRERQIKVLEVNARYWGSLRGSYVAGVSFPYLACLTALDITFPIPQYALKQYIHSKAALKEGVLRILGRQQSDRFTLEETGLKYVLIDPVAETLRSLRQELSTKR